MEMQQIRYFLAVCSERNFTRASRLCRISQPSLTRAIKLLEKEFGGPLFRRDRANSPLTELGEVVRPHLQEIWEQSHSAKAHAHEFMTVSTSRIRIGVMSTITPTLLVGLLRRSRHRNRAVEFEILDGTASDLEEQLLKGRIGAAIYSKSDEDSDPRFDRTPLFRERMLIAMPKDHKLASRAAIAITDLSGEPYVRRARCEFNDVMAALFRKHGMECNVSSSSERDDWALALIGNRFGLGLLPEHTIKCPGIVSRPLAELEIWREVSLVTLKGRPHNKGLAALVHEAMQGRVT
jgi:LysR family hydrogen peroxide-inducible transcriptional activator